MILKFWNSRQSLPCLLLPVCNFYYFQNLVDTLLWRTSMNNTHSTRLNSFYLHTCWTEMFKQMNLNNCVISSIADFNFRCSYSCYTCNIFTYLFYQLTYSTTFLASLYFQLNKFIYLLLLYYGKLIIFFKWSFKCEFSARVIQGIGSFQRWWKCKTPLNGFAAFSRSVYFSNIDNNVNLSASVLLWTFKFFNLLISGQIHLLTSL